MRMPRATVLALPALLALAPQAALAAPVPFTSDLFEVAHTIPTLDGASARAMTDFERDHFLNRARCECGQPLRTEIRVRPDPPELDNTKLILSFLGSECATAESDPTGPFRRCGLLATSTALGYVDAKIVDHHPIFLASGVDPSAGDRRNINDPDTILADTCNGSQGEPGVWVCAQTNTTVGCQADEFFLQPQPPRLRWDFLPPVGSPDDLTATPARGGVTLSWTLDTPADIHGLRVLCERSDGKPAGNQNFATPDPVAEADGTHYFTQQNLCGDKPFLPFTTAAKPTGDGSCGDGQLDPGEACDDGDNFDAGPCRSDCTLTVSPGLHALDWDYLCSDHISVDETSVNIHGLENGVDYRFLLVTYDASGNPRIIPQVLHATPDASLEALPGDPEGCACTTTSTAPTTSALLLLAALGLTRRRRRPPVATTPGTPAPR